MWPFKKKIDSLSESGFFSGLTDWHSHILPGVDDGISKMEMSLKTLAQYEKWGIRTLWLTPHIMEDYPNTPDSLRKRFDELKAQYSGPIEINLAAEHMLDALFEERIVDNNVLPIGPEKDHLLIETSYFNPPIEFDGMLEEIFSKGYYPLLAHPERYRYMDNKRYEELKEKGVKFQLNFNSLIGGYGTLAQTKAEWLLKNDMIDVVGSDLHRLETKIKMSECSPRKKESLDQLLKIAESPRIG